MKLGKVVWFWRYGDDDDGILLQAVNVSNFDRERTDDNEKNMQFTANGMENYIQKTK